MSIARATAGRACWQLTDCRPWWLACLSNSRFKLQGVNAYQYSHTCALQDGYGRVAMPERRCQALHQARYITGAGRRLLMAQLRLHQCTCTPLQRLSSATGSAVHHHCRHWHLGFVGSSVCRVPSLFYSALTECRHGAAGADGWGDPGGPSGC
jgi:hypothetical protein